MRHLMLAALTAAALSSAACFESLTPTAPAVSTSTIASLATGTYASVASVGSTGAPTNVCTDFQWTVTSVSATSMAGSFSALCYGTARLTGTALGSVSGSTITWTASGNAVTPTTSTCAVSLSGTVEISASQIRVPYTGTTCMGPVSGAEILRR